MPIFGNPESSLIGPPGSPGLAPNLGLWAIGANYVVGDWVYHAKVGYGLCMFRCKLDHLADAGNEPITGGTYDLYWDFGPQGGQDGSGNVSTDVSPTTPGKIPAWDIYIVELLPITEILLNPGFEVAGAGAPDTVADWSEHLSDGSIERTIAAGEFRSGVAGLKITTGVTVDDCWCIQSAVVTPSVPYVLTFWTRGDATNAGRYQIIDNTHGVAITTILSTGVIGATFTKVTYSFIVPVGCLSIGIALFGPGVNAGIAYFDDVSFHLGVIHDKYLVDGYGVSTVISDASLDTELPTAKAVNDLVDNVGFFLTMTKDRLINDGKVHAFVIPGDLPFILDDDTYHTIVTSGYLVVKW